MHAYDAPVFQPDTVIESGSPFSDGSCTKNDPLAIVATDAASKDLEVFI